MTYPHPMDDKTGFEATDEEMGLPQNAPQQWRVCPACDGSGVEVFGVRVYEPGCGFAHDSSDERPCAQCRGDGGHIVDVDACDGCGGAVRGILEFGQIWAFCQQCSRGE